MRGSSLGSSHHFPGVQTADDEGLLALGRSAAPVSVPSSQPQSANNMGVCGGSSAMEKCCLPKSQGSARTGGIQRNHDNRRFPVRVGSDYVGEIGKWEVGSEFDWFSYKHLGVVGNSTVMAYRNRQGGTRSLQLHKLAHKVIIWSSSWLLFLRATHVPGVLNRGADFLSREKPTIRRVETLPTSGGTDLAETQQSSRRSIRLARKRTMSSVFLPVEQKCTSGCGCIRAPVDRRAALCVSSVQPDLPDSDQSERAAPDIDHDPPYAGIFCPKEEGRFTTHTQNAWRSGFG